MFKGEKDAERINEEYIGYEERKKLLWSLKSEFAWEGKKIPESVEIEGQECKLKDLIRNLGETELIDPDEAAEIKDLIRSSMKRQRQTKSCWKQRSSQRKKPKCCMKKQPDLCGLQWS